MSYKGKIAGKAMRSRKVCVVMRLALLQSVHSKSEIGPVKERGIFRPSDGVVAVENVRR